MKKKMRLESRVKMLRPDSLDPDMLEEQSRKLLYFSHKDDIIVILNDKKNKELVYFNFCYLSKRWIKTDYLFKFYYSVFLKLQWF
jgi:hypothetical protein